MRPEGILTIEEWVACLKSGIVSPEMPTDVVRGFFHHLADLGIFERGEGSLWSLGETPAHEVSEALAKKVDSLIKAEKAVFVPYFLHPPRDLPDILSLKFDAPSSTQSTSASAEKKVSDFSNLQIVKKIGRQLEPFIELEKQFNQCVEGPNTSKDEVRILFSYLLGKNREKGKAREWEQLSRRRHK